MDTELLNISEKTVNYLLKRKETITSAESCTGGLISTFITEIPGSSDCFKGGLCTYTEAAKTTLLGIPGDKIRHHGVVSRFIAIEMAKSIQGLLSSDFAVSTTGIAGPSGGSTLTPIGTVWYGIASPSSCEAFCLHLSGNRNKIRKEAVLKILTHLYTEHLREQA